jgi:hypothetical protein
MRNPRVLVNVFDVPRNRALAELDQLIAIADGRTLQKSEKQGCLASLSLYSMESNINWGILEYVR